MMALETSRLLLRPFTPADAPDLHRLLSDPAVSGTLMDVDGPLTPADVSDGVHPGCRSVGGPVSFVHSPLAARTPMVQSKAAGGSRCCNRFGMSAHRRD